MQGYAWETYKRAAERATHIGSGLIRLGYKPKEAHIGVCAYVGGCVCVSVFVFVDLSVHKSVDVPVCLCVCVSGCVCVRALRGGEAGV